MGPRGHGPIKQKCSLCELSRFPNDILEFWTWKNLFVSPVGFQTTFWNFGHLKTNVGKIITHHENPCFFQHGKDAHRDSAKVALNDSSRSLIWNFLEQIVFLKICEKCQKYQNWINFGYIPDGLNNSKFCENSGKFGSEPWT